jgi:coronin-1B/1C/6
VDLLYHQRRVGLVLWHPSALNVLLTAGSDNQVAIWNVGTGEILVHIDCHPDIVLSACFNWDGSQLVTTCKDKKIRIINPRTGEIESEALCHEGSKATRAIFLRHGLIFTTGYVFTHFYYNFMISFVDFSFSFNKSSERQYSLRAPDALSEPIVMVDLDTSNGIMFPLYDPDTNLVFLCGKGDSVIRYFEVTPEPPFVHYINTFQTPDPQRGIGLMPKRGCDVSTCEISRFYRLNNSGLCQVITFTVPRKSELFQEDLYPDTLSDEAAISAEDWIGGSDADPLLVSLKVCRSISVLVCLLFHPSFTNINCVCDSLSSSFWVHHHLHSHVKVMLKNITNSSLYVFISSNESNSIQFTSQHHHYSLFQLHLVHVLSMLFLSQSSFLFLSLT